ncbi:polyunsaturated fatty acid lipoxygenase ALOX15B-like [Centropristis striata]|uniref:polyunsaturated fatty acid lipoxygenase ALOX15B-like n=1 Tax=Centropristis striata TaxID=184440 RepID=UPI0027DEE692|nr:polyunsaturated fatty acid lipoxygenase ALOX15B-like [Centropristis striata]
MDNLPSVTYEATVFIGDLDDGSLISIFIKLVGTDGESARTLVRFRPLPLPLCVVFGWKWGQHRQGEFKVSCHSSIGKLFLIELQKKIERPWSPDSWFHAKIEVKSPEGDTYNFPIYNWISGSEVHRFREGTALRVFEESHHLGLYSREQELCQRERDYRWRVYAEGIPHCLEAEDLDKLPSEVKFSKIKNIELFFSRESGLRMLNLMGLTNSKENWSDTILVFTRQTDISAYVQRHWKEDSFFGYQYLNGINPILIRRCSALPDNFPVTDNMVFPGGQCSLADEMKKGNMFLCDYKRLDGLEVNNVDGKRQYLMAPLVLLHKTPDDKLMPIAIQLKQTPADDNPIFFPTDSEYDWLLAKIFVRSADFNEHELNVHLLRTHLLAEVFAVSLLRNLPMVHPLYKLLIPHTSGTAVINNLARALLISENGFFKKYTATGGEGVTTLLKRSLSSMTYSSLCIPEDIAERGLEDVPNFYYRDDGLKLWDIIHRFVQRVLGFYYKSDDEVLKDSELQKWIADIYEHGFLSQASTGIPQSFTTVAEMVKFVTMVIFTGSAQHSAVNGGQFDYSGWMPNSPVSLQHPPPTTKGTTSKATMLQTLPNKGATANGMAVLWLLSQQYSDFVPLGHYPMRHFSEEVPRKLIKVFQAELEVLSAVIKARNKSLEIPYTYLTQAEVDNSVAI